ncbi:MAG TPA: HAMP domain-containing sensor histidine kinase [Longimicrobiales bacterium]
MSVHGKIVAWVLFFAAMTVLVFVLGDYLQSTRALEVALEARARGIAGQTAAEIDRRHSRAETELLALGYGVATGRRVPTQLVPEGTSSIRVFRGERVVWETSARPVDADADVCAAPDVPFAVSFEDAAGQAYRVESAIRATHFFSRISGVTARLGNGGATTVLRTSDGAVVFDHGCMLESGAIPTAVQQAVAAHVVSARDEVAGAAMVPVGGTKEQRLIAHAAAERLPWSVAVAVDVAEFARPFLRVHRQYLGIMLFVLVLALVFVIRMIRHDMKRLMVISDAADVIGHGRFDVWLPPPTSDEIGRLSFALGSMANRLSTTLHQIEVTRAMAVAGEMASYLSHEVRNPLSSIRLNLQMLRRDLSTGEVPEDSEQIVDLCLGELQRLDDVVKTVLEVGRPSQSMKDASCDAHAVIRNTVHMLEGKLGSGQVAVELDLEAGAGEASIDPTQLKGVLINLMLNAVDAMRDCEVRRITIRTAVRQGVGPGPHLEIGLADTGPGVPAHLRERIFEPFFTTKPSGNGIGLATSRRILQERGGLLRYAAAPEGATGAEFIIEIPLAGYSPADDEATALAAAG